MEVVNPPSIVRMATDAEMEQYAFEATSALEASAKAAKTTLERYRDAGEALAKAKAKCKHGQWLPWLASHGIDKFQASRAIRIFEHWSKFASDANVKSAFRTLAKDGEEEEILDPVSNLTLLCRRCRLWPPPKENCEECEALRNPPEREPGDDTAAEQAEVEQCNPYVKKIDRIAEGASKIAQEVARRDVDPKDAETVKNSLQQGIEGLRRLALAPVKAGPPRKAKCKKCGKDILWVKTSRGKNMALNAEPLHRGEFEIVKGVALFVAKEARAAGMSLYRAHFQTCTVQKRK